MRNIGLSLIIGATLSVLAPWANSSCYALNDDGDEFLRDAEPSQSGGIAYPPGVTEPGAANVTGPVYWYCKWQDQYVEIGEACVPFGQGKISYDPTDPPYCFRTILVIEGKEEEVVFCGKGLVSPYDYVGPGFIISNGDPGKY
jgi:hypothetical protein